MTDMDLFIIAIVGFVISFAAFWLEYKLSGCAYGGAYSGKDHWLLRTVSKHIRRDKTKRRIFVRDICDI